MITLLQPIVPTGTTDLLTAPTNIYLQYGALGATCVLLVAAVIYFVVKIGREREKYEGLLKDAHDKYIALQEKRHEDHRLVAEKHIIVLADNARTIDTLATTSEKHTATLDELVSSHEKVVLVIEEVRRSLDNNPRGRGGR